MIRTVAGVFWGLFLWGLLTLAVPIEVLRWVFMTLGAITLPAVCIIIVLFSSDYIATRIERWRERVNGDL